MWSFRPLFLAFIFVIILREINSVEVDEKVTPPISSGFLQSLLPKTLGPEFTAFMKNGQILADLLKLKWQRVVQVGTAALGLGLAMLLKMFLLWVGPFLASAPAQAIRDAVTKEASRELLSNAVMSGVATLQNLYG